VAATGGHVVIEQEARAGIRPAPHHEQGHARRELAGDPARDDVSVGSLGNLVIPEIQG
jgi:hypothetical protein